MTNNPSRTGPNVWEKDPEVARLDIHKDSVVIATDALSRIIDLHIASLPPRTPKHRKEPNEEVQKDGATQDTPQTPSN